MIKGISAAENILSICVLVFIEKPKLDESIMYDILINSLDLQGVNVHI
jgi:hypothetical protein